MSLRGEITARVSASYQISIFAYTATAAVWALSFQFVTPNANALFWPTILGVPIVICIFAGKITNHNTIMIAEIASYLRKFHEQIPVLDNNGKLTTPSWETLWGRKQIFNNRKRRFAHQNDYESIVHLAYLVVGVSVFALIVITFGNVMSIDTTVLSIFDTDYSTADWIVALVCYFVCVVLPASYMFIVMDPKKVEEGTYKRIGKGWDDPRLFDERLWD